MAANLWTLWNITDVLPAVDLNSTDDWSRRRKLVKKKKNKQTSYLLEDLVSQMDQANQYHPEGNIADMSRQMRHIT